MSRAADQARERLSELVELLEHEEYDAALRYLLDILEDWDKAEEL